MTTAIDLGAKARAATESAIQPNAAAVDRERRYPRQGLDALAQAGLAGLTVPPQYGGLGGSLSDLVSVLQEVGRGCASTAMCFLMHCCGTAVIAAKATPEQGEAWLRPAAAGQALATLAFSERGTGAHFYAPDLTLTRDGGGLTLNSRKSFITSGGQATLYPVLVQSPAGEGLDIFVLTRDMPGVSFEGSWQGIGMAGNSSVAGRFENVAVPESNRLGAAGDGQALVFDVVGPTFLTGLAAVSVGIAQAALEAAIEHARSRTYSSGQTLAEVPAIQDFIAAMAVRTESARRLVQAAAAAGDAGDEAALALIFEAKIGATQAAQEVTQTAMEVGGGQAYSGTLSIERHWRDARAGSVMAPTNAVLSTWLGKALTGLPLF